MILFMFVFELRFPRFTLAQRFLASAVLSRASLPPTLLSPSPRRVVLSDQWYHPAYNATQWLILQAKVGTTGKMVADDLPPMFMPASANHAQCGGLWLTDLMNTTCDSARGVCSARLLSRALACTVVLRSRLFWALGAAMLISECSLALLARTLTLRARLLCALGAAVLAMHAQPNPLL